MLCAAVAATVPTMNRHTHTRHLRSAATASKSVVVVAAPPPPPAAAAAASVTVPSSEQWRCYGQARRRWLVENDKAAISFRMNAACSIHKYFSLAERVILQFQLLCEQDAIEDAYVMGHRLIAFLSVALPRHPAYHSASQQRAACEQNLTWIRAQMGQIAIRIDEDQLNKFITNDFDPVIPDDDDATSSDEDDEAETTPQQGTWERFAGWSFDLQHDVPGAVDTDESSQDIDEEQFAGLDRQLAAVAEADDDDPDPDLEDISLQEEDDEALVYERDAPVLASTNFLKKIAKEDVRYESDSEAADSWAQDGRSDTTCSESEVLSCDPARIAFREIMGRQQERNVSPPPPPPPPANSPEILDVGKGRSTGFSTHAAIRRLP